MTTEDTKVKVGTSVTRPWGYYSLLVYKENYSVKILHINPGEETSLQRHSKRQEIVILLDGKIEIFLHSRSYIKDAESRGSSIRILPFEWHRFKALDEPATLIEVAYGELDPDDFERKHDKYKRVRKVGPGFKDKGLNYETH